MRDFVAIQRIVLRWIHLVCAIPIIGYIYSPFEAIPDYAPLTRYVFVPVMVLVDYGCGKAIGFGGSSCNRRFEWQDS